MANPRPSELWHLARTPRFLLRAGLALLLIVAFAFLGHWQWQRTQDVLASERAGLAQVVAVDSLNPLGQSLTSQTVGRAVTATGAYRPEQQKIVVHRGLGDKTGVWVVTPLELADGSLIAVMRGWLPEGQTAGLTPPSGQIEVTGVLEADESFYKGAASSAGQVAAISQQSLHWGPTARTGFIMLASQEPEIPSAPIPVPAPAQSAEVDFPFQNFFYAFQWWVFGIFVMAVYLRWLWLDAQLLKDDQAAPPPEPAEQTLD